MGKPRNIRFGADLEEAIEDARKKDRRRDFTDEVVFLVELGLEEAKCRREAIERDYKARHLDKSSLPGAVGGN